MASELETMATKIEYFAQMNLRDSCARSRPGF
jgi:hypothetical protein